MRSSEDLRSWWGAKYTVGVSALMVLAVASSSASAEPPGHRVLVWDNAKLLSAPRADAPFVRHYRWSASERAKRVGDALVMRFIAQKGGYFELESVVGTDSLSCYPSGLSGLESLQVRVFVGTQDVVMATNAPVERTFSDGTSIRLPAGVAILTDDKGTTVGVDGLLFQLTGPLRGALYFRPPPRPKTPVPVHSIAREAILHYDGQREILRRRGRVSPTTVEDEGDEGHDGMKALTLAGRCGRYHVTVGADQELSLTGDSPTDQVTVPATPAATLAKGVVLYWPDGREAGIVRQPLAVPSTRPVGRFACFESTLATDPARLDADPDHRTLELCVTRSELTPR